MPIPPASEPTAAMSSLQMSERMQHVAKRIIQPLVDKQPTQAMQGANELVIWLGMISVGPEAEKLPWHRV